MATEVVTGVQAIGEIRTHYCDFTADLPSGVTIASAAAVHAPPSGAASTPTVGATLAGDIVPVTLPAQTVTGRHILEVTATLSNGDKSIIRLIVPVEWESARSGMVDLIAELRGLADAGSNDYSVGGVPHWTDKQLQDVLDRLRRDVYRQPVTRAESYSGGSVLYKDYYIGHEHVERSDGGTAIWYLETAAGSAVGTALYTVDYRTGHVTFATSTGGSAYYWYGRVYDLNRAAADIWRRKAAHFAGMFDFKTDNHEVKRSGMAAQALKMAEYYEQQAYSGGAVIVGRSDTDAW